MAFPATTEASCSAYLPVAYLEKASAWSGNRSRAMWTLLAPYLLGTPSFVLARDERTTTLDVYSAWACTNVHIGVFYARSRGLCSVRARSRHRIK